MEVKIPALLNEPSTAYLYQNSKIHILQQMPVSKQPLCIHNFAQKAL